MRSGDAGNRSHMIGDRSHRTAVVVLVIAAVVLVAALAPSRADAAFGVADWHARRSPTRAARSSPRPARHPFKGVTDFTMNTTGGVPDGNVKDVRVDLPPGIISNPEATPKCTTAQYDALACPASSQLGTEEVTIRELILTTTLKVPIYNMVPPPGRVSDFSFGVPVISPRTQILGGVRTQSQYGDYGLFFEIFDIPASPQLIRSKLTFWGVPADPAHDAERGAALPADVPRRRPAEQRRPRPVHHEPDVLRADAEDLPDRHRAHRREGRRQSTRRRSAPAAATPVPFAPSMSVTPATTKRDSPTGLGVKLSVPQSLDPDELGSAHVKQASVTLPPGLTLNPSAANGLDSCSDAQFDKPSAARPGAARRRRKIGNVSVASHTIPSPADRLRLCRPAARRQPLPHLRPRRRPRHQREAGGQGHARPGDRAAHDDVLRQPAAAVHRLHPELRPRPACPSSPRRWPAARPPRPARWRRGPASPRRRRAARSPSTPTARAGPAARRRSRSASRPPPARRRREPSARSRSTSPATTGTPTCRRSRCASRRGCWACCAASRAAPRPTRRAARARRRAASAPRRRPPAPAASRSCCRAPSASPAPTRARRSGCRSRSALSPGPTTSGPSSCAPRSASTRTTRT